MTAGIPSTEANWKLIPKVLLTRIGAVSGQRTMRALNGVLNYMHVGWWMRSRGLTLGVRVRSRYQLFDLVAAEIGDRRVLYLEFGVQDGASIRYWSRLLLNSRSHLHGFDSFVGLPHDWTFAARRGDLSTAGVVPIVDDPRVEFFPGWFEESLPFYEWPEYDELVVMLDADIYSSTATALKFVRERLQPGAYVYFDEFQCCGDELRAFSELVDEHRLNFRLVGASHELKHVLFRCVA
jgi:hypothetical protein